MDELIVVSVDSHATMPASAWSEYLEPEYHGYLPDLHEDNDRWHGITERLGQMLWSIPEVLEVVDERGVHGPGLEGLWNAKTRLAEMDREGIAAEFVYFGDHRAAVPFVDVGIREYGTELHLAGLRAYHRWAADEFGAHTDRLRLVGGAGYGADLDAMLTELDWLADHGFAGTYAAEVHPRRLAPPLFDEFWEPFWARCEAYGLQLFVHAGHGVESGAFYRAAMTVEQEMQRADDPDAVDWGSGTSPCSPRTGATCSPTRGRDGRCGS